MPVRSASDVRRDAWMRMQARAEILRRLVAQQGGLCALCRHPFTPKRGPTLDHIFARCRGGRTVSANLQAAHRDCNQIKGELSMDGVRKRVAKGRLRWPEPETTDGAAHG